MARPPRSLLLKAGCYCLDSFTPLGPGCYAAARRAVDCTLTAADAILRGRRIAYALVRPPGHHAERHCFGGYCYLNNTAVAAQYLSHRGKVAILDLDYHHGNGQQDIFYRRDDVLTISLHGHPDVAYPYFSGYADEQGVGPGEGFNLQFPAAGVGRRAAVSAGPEPRPSARSPTSSRPFWSWRWAWTPPRATPAARGAWGPRTSRRTGKCWASCGSRRSWFKRADTASAHSAPTPDASLRVFCMESADPAFRCEVRPEDREHVRRIVASTGFFNPAEVEVAVELVHERLTRGPASGYHFVFVENDGRVLGYACYGHIAGTAASYDLYWIAVDHATHRRGLGQRLMAEAERLIHEAGGRRVYIETSDRAQYAPTRRFYERAGYRVEAILKDFYAPGDDKAIYVKVLPERRVGWDKAERCPTRHRLHRRVPSTRSSVRSARLGIGAPSPGLTSRARLSAFEPWPVALPMAGLSLPAWLRADGAAVAGGCPLACRSPAAAGEAAGQTPCGFHPSWWTDQGRPITTLAAWEKKA